MIENGRVDTGWTEETNIGKDTLYDQSGEFQREIEGEKEIVW